MTDMLDDILAHHGVKGMKWGVNRKSSRSGSASEESSAKTAITAKAKAGGVASLSNKELQTAIARMSLERNFNNLAPKSRVQKGREFASQLILGTGKNQIQQVANQLAAQQVQEALKNTKK